MVLARAGLLDAFDALSRQLDALVIVGAQAIYLHTGSLQVALAEYTTDADVVLDPELLGSDPRIEQAMAAAGFSPDPRGNVIGTWLSPSGVPVDLMVPHAVAGSGRRSVSLPPHDPKSMRRARGLEAALVDNSEMRIGALDAADARVFQVAVAGPAALLVAKLHKIHDRLGSPSRQDNKDAHDVYRLLRAIDTGVLAEAVERLQGEEVSASVTHEALVHLRELFAEGASALGSVMAGAAEELVGEPAAVRESVTLLAQDLLDVINA